MNDLKWPDALGTGLVDWTAVESAERALADAHWFGTQPPCSMPAIACPMPAIAWSDADGDAYRLQIGGKDWVMPDPPTVPLHDQHRNVIGTVTVECCDENGMVLALRLPGHRGELELDWFAMTTPRDGGPLVCQTRVMSAGADTPVVVEVPSWRG